jgi:protein-disulfide isomerase
LRKSSRALCPAGLRSFFLAGVTLPLLIGLATAQETGPRRTPLATLGGQTIYEDELAPMAQSQLQKMEQQVYAVRRNALEGIVQQRLIEAEAKKRGVTVEEIVTSEADSRVPDPTNDEIAAYYQARQAQYKQPLEEVKDKVAAAIKNEKVNFARRSYFQAILLKALESGQLRLDIRPPRFDAGYDSGRLRGAPDAPVTIVEFSDFSCPYCRSVEPRLTALLSKYSGKVKLGYRDFPLSQIHPQAELAAEASRCAGEQGKFWEYHDLLFSTPADKQDHDSLLQDAQTLKLDSQAFDTCLKSGRFKAEVQKDQQLGTRAGVVGTPGFFINGVFIDGAQPPEAFERLINEALSEQATQEKRPTR